MTGAAFSLETTVPPATEPVTVAAAKLHCRVDWTDEDDLFNIWVPAARRLTEDVARRRWVTQTVRLTLPGWADDCYEWPAGLAGIYRSSLLPADYGSAIRLPVDPVSAVSAVQYYATSGTLTTLAADQYQTWLAHSPPLLSPAPNCYWPALEAGRMAAVRVTMTAGYGVAASVPQDAKSAILLTIGYWYRNRGDGKDPASVQALGMPPGVERLLKNLDTGGYR